MPRRALLLLLLVVGVVLAGAGTALVLDAGPLGAAGFGWTAYSPLSSSAYSPGDPTWLFWMPKLSAALLALGAGTAGACAAALVLHRDRAAAGGRGR